MMFSCSFCAFQSDDYLQQHRCEACGKIAPLHQQSASYFECFGLPVSFQVDLSLLQKRYFRIGSRTHPDRCTVLSAAEKTDSLHRMSYVNAAYVCLQQMGSRRTYILSKLFAHVSVPVEQATSLTMPLSLEWFDLMEEKDPHLWSTFHQKVACSLAQLESDRLVFENGFEHQTSVEQISAIRALKAIEARSRTLHALMVDIDRSIHACASDAS